MSGPLSGYRIIEIAGIGPGPFAAMMLSDMGAEVIRVERTQAVRPGGANGDIMQRNRRNIAIDLKADEGRDTLLRLVENADALIEGFRPGVMERLGLGPDTLLAANPKLVYGRTTGWGQDGPLAARAGHDIDYIALSGALHAIGRSDGPPVPPLNLVGDFGGGGMLLAFGIACALIEVRRSGQGQVVDAAMIEGASLLTTMIWGMQAAQQWTDTRGANVLDSGAPWYDTYETSDHRHVAVGAIEPKFYAELLERLGLANAALPDQNDRASWPALRARLAAVFATRTRDEWSRVFADSDACVAPVLTFTEATRHPHFVARHSHITVGAVTQPAPAPRLSRTPGAVRRPPPERGALGREALAEWGFADEDIERLRALGLGYRD